MPGWSLRGQGLVRVHKLSRGVSVIWKNILVQDKGKCTKERLSLNKTVALENHSSPLADIFTLIQTENWLWFLTANEFWQENVNAKSSKQGSSFLVNCWKFKCTTSEDTLTILIINIMNQQIVVSKYPLVELGYNNSCNNNNKIFN